MTGLTLLVCRRSNVYSPNSRGCWEQQKCIVTLGGWEIGEGRVVSVLKSTWVKCMKGKFLFVVMVTGSVVCSKKHIPSIEA